MPASPQEHGLFSHPVPPLGLGTSDIIFEDAEFPLWESLSTGTANQPGDSSFVLDLEALSMPDICLSNYLPLGTSTARSTDEQWIPEDIYDIGYQDLAGCWRCKHAACTSDRVFSRACDIRKHYNSHTKVYFCMDSGCLDFTIGFSSRKDYQRHVNSHNPQIPCAAPTCPRLFSRKGKLEAASPCIQGYYN
jgi:hypothetical protein